VGRGSHLLSLAPLPSAVARLGCFCGESILAARLVQEWVLAWQVA
jgi:hypothetical protein